MTEPPKFELTQGSPLQPAALRGVSQAISGRGVTEPGALELTSDPDRDMGLLVSPGGYLADGPGSLDQQAELSPSAGHADHDRWDTASLDPVADEVVYREGAAGQYPVPPEPADGELLIGIVEVPQGATDLGDDLVQNWRAMPQGAAGVPDGDGGTVAGRLEDLASRVDGAVFATQDVAADATASAAVVFADTTGGPLTVTLPDGAGEGARAEIIDAGGAAGSDPVTIETGGAGSVDGGASTEVGSAWGAAVLVCDGDDWYTAGGGTGSGGITRHIDEGFLASGDAPAEFGPLFDVPTDGMADGDPIGFSLAVGGEPAVQISAAADGSGGARDVSVDVTGDGGGGAGPAEDRIHVQDTTTVAADGSATLLVDRLGPDRGLRVDMASLTTDSAGPAADGVSLSVVTFAGGGYTTEETVLEGDGATVRDRAVGDPLARHDNPGDAGETVGVILENGGGAEATLAVSVRGSLVDGTLADPALAQMLSRRQSEMNATQIAEAAGTDDRTSQALARRGA